MGKLTIKHRPETLDDVKGQDENIEYFKGYVKRGYLSDMIFCGPAGVGKTTSAWAMLYDLYGEKVHSYVLEINASDHNSIDDVRGLVSDFMSTRPSGEALQKTLVFEESDELTPPAQKALKDITEKYEENCAVIFICNNPQKIIEPIVSRCAVFEFNPLSLEETVELVTDVCNEENINLGDPEIVKIVCQKYRGDMRRILNDAIEKFSVLNREITLNDVRPLVSPAKIAQDLIKMIIGDKKPSPNEVIKKFETYIKENRTIKIRDIIKECSKFAVKLKAPELVEILAETDYRIVCGGDDILQFEAFILRAI